MARDRGYRLRRGYFAVGRELCAERAFFVFSVDNPPRMNHAAGALRTGLSVIKLRGFAYLRRAASARGTMRLEGSRHVFDPEIESLESTLNEDQHTFLCRIRVNHCPRVPWSNPNFNEDSAVIRLPRKQLIEP